MQYGGQVARGSFGNVNHFIIFYTINTLFNDIYYYEIFNRLAKNK